ncbi:hypothetical protein [Microbulbifer sp. TRSA005]|uniref:hypothetical protein n=1 Tax=Microbulbifer sp. TRSA005 TaxID=3243383 RepID=UPI00403971FC
MLRIVAAMCLLISSSVLGSEIYGKYESESTIGLGLFGGHILEVNKGGFIHQMTTDILCDRSDPNCHLNNPPYRPYRGSYSLHGNQITFQSEFMDEKSYFYVKYRNQEFLLTESEKFAFDQARRLPPVVLIKVADSAVQNQP